MKPWDFISPSLASTLCAFPWRNIYLIISRRRCMGGTLSMWTWSHYGRWQKKHRQWSTPSHFSALILNSHCDINVMKIHTVSDVNHSQHWWQSMLALLSFNVNGYFQSSTSQKAGTIKLYCQIWLLLYKKAWKESKPSTKLYIFFFFLNVTYVFIL